MMLTGAVALLAAALALTWYAVDRAQRAGWLNGPHGAHSGPGPLRRFADWLCGDDDWDGQLDARDIADVFRGEAPVMAGHYDVPRPGEQPTVSGPEGATGVNAQAGPGHPLSAGEMDPDAPWCPGCGFASYSAGPCEVCGYDDQNVPRPGHGTQRDAAAPLSSGHETPRPGYPGGCPNCGRPGFDGGVCGRCGWGYGWQPASEAAVSAVYGPGELPLTAPVPEDDTVTDWAPRVCAGRNPWVQPAPAPPLPAWVQECLGAPTVGAALADIWAMSQVPALAAAT